MCQLQTHFILKISRSLKLFLFLKIKVCYLIVVTTVPISLLTNINKIIEKLMHKRLYSFLCKYNSIYINQLGFRKHHSTSHALIGITEHICHALDNNDIAC